MTLSTLTIISLLLAVYGLVAIIRDIVVGVTNAIKQYKANKVYKSMIQDFKEAIDRMPNLNEAVQSMEWRDNQGRIKTELPSTKRKYNKSGKYKKANKKSK